VKYSKFCSLSILSWFFKEDKKIHHAYKQPPKTMKGKTYPPIRYNKDPKTGPQTLPNTYLFI